MSDPALRERFARLWARLGASGDGAEAFDAVYTRWEEPHRRYHGVDHLRDCLARLDEAPPGADDRAEAEAALWYHDAVYRPGAHDNEERSAEAASASLHQGGVPEHRARRVAELVRATDHLAPPSDATAALVCDVDLSILGRDPEAFAEYERRIREEYRHLPEPLYVAGRSRVLAALLGRDPLFLTPHFRRRYEAAARRNLRRALADLVPSRGT